MHKQNSLCLQRARYKVLRHIVGALMLASLASVLYAQSFGRSSTLGGAFQGSRGATMPGFVTREAAQAKKNLAMQQAEPGEVLMIWDDADSGGQGLDWLQQKYGLAPFHAVKLDALGAAVALFKLHNADQAQQWAQEVAQAQPDWWIAPNVRYAAATPRLPLPDGIGVVGGAQDDTTPSFLLEGQTQARYPAALPLGRQAQLVSVLRLQVRGGSVSNTYAVLRAVDALAHEGYKRIFLAVKASDDPVLLKAAQAFARHQVEVVFAP